MMNQIMTTEKWMSHHFHPFKTGCLWFQVVNIVNKLGYFTLLRTLGNQLIGVTYSYNPTCNYSY